jgi:hypothetical protein
VGGQPGTGLHTAESIKGATHMAHVEHLGTGVVIDAQSFSENGGPLVLALATANGKGNTGGS